MFQFAVFIKKQRFAGDSVVISKIALGLGVLVLTSACGIEPTGPVGSDNGTVESREVSESSSGDATGKLPVDTSEPLTSDLPTNFDELQADPKFKVLLAQEAESACHIEDTLFDRRSGGCFDEFQLASNYSCSRQGILVAFKDTGFQISAVLNDALGRSTDPNDRGAGFIIDQCGEAKDGRLLVTLVGPSYESSTAQLRVRELEAQVTE